MKINTTNYEDLGNGWRLYRLISRGNGKNIRIQFNLCLCGHDGMVINGESHNYYRKRDAMAAFHGLKA